MTKEQSAALQIVAIEALQLQDACNASGVVRTMSQALSTLWQSLPHVGTDAVNTHAVTLLYLFKLADLAGGTFDHPNLSEAFKTCRALAEGQTTDGTQAA